MTAAQKRCFILKKAIFSGTAHHIAMLYILLSFVLELESKMFSEAVSSAYQWQSWTIFWVKWNFQLKKHVDFSKRWTKMRTRKPNNFLFINFKKYNWGNDKVMKTKQQQVNLQWTHKIQILTVKFSLFTRKIIIKRLYFAAFFTKFLLVWKKSHLLPKPLNNCFWPWQMLFIKFDGMKLFKMLFVSLIPDYPVPYVTSDWCSTRFNEYVILCLF